MLCFGARLARPWMAAGVGLVVVSATAISGVPTPAGLWTFDDVQDLLQASIGRDLQLEGEHAAIAGAYAGDGAVRIGIGSHYVCDHGITPDPEGTHVNRYSLLVDFRIPQIGPWYCFFQTSPDNQDDGDCFVRANDGALGVGQTGYSATGVSAGRWQRLIVSVDNTLGTYCLYLDGSMILDGNPQAADGRFALAPTLLLFADENGEDAPIDVARVAVYSGSLSAAVAAELGTASAEDPANEAPTVSPGPAGPTVVTTGQSQDYQFTASDLDQDLVQILVDWGDGTELGGWSDLVPPRQWVSLGHVYRQPGTWPIRALARDSSGKTGTWTVVQVVEVTGGAVVRFLTPPYLQNVKPDGITLMWELDLPTEADVAYGPDAGSGSRQACTHEPSDAGTHIYRCTLTGLTPGSTYEYRVRAGDRDGPGGRFTTAPSGSPDFSFGVWADSQGSNHGTYAADPLEPTQSMLRNMAGSGLAFGVGAGDLAEDGGSYTDTRQYYLDRVARWLGATVPWFVAWGNHDGGPGTVIRQFADLPSRDRPGFGPGYGSYSFDFAGCHFICLDHATAPDDVLSWLEGDLQSNANRNARFTFLFVHVPPYCELWIDGDEFLRSALVPLMEAHGVDVCFSGHTHEYSRGFRNGVYYCISGGGSWLDTPELLVAEWDHMTVGGQHPIPGVPQPGPDRGGGLINEYVRVDVRGNSCTASMIAFQPDGTEIGVLDRFSMSPSPGSNPPDTPQVSGPAEFDVFGGTALVLESSRFTDRDPQASHLQSVWRLSRTADVQTAADVVFEAITGPQVFTCSVPLSRLWPGQTLHASVKHVASDGRESAFAVSIPLRLRPDPIYREDFEAVPEFSLPQGWTAQHLTAVDRDAWDPTDPRSNTYQTWTVISRERLAQVGGANRVNVSGVIEGNSVYAESDHRSGLQIQHLTTPDLDLRDWTNVWLLFRSNYMQNQDSLAALEYSVDRGVEWRPLIYLLDGPDVVRTPDGLGIDAGETFTRVDPDGVPTADGASATGGTYGEHVLSRPFENLAAFIQARVNDDPVESKRVERFHLAQADGEAHIRFRFTLVGTASWFWGIDDFSLFGAPTAVEPFQITRIHASTNGLDLEWSGPVGPCRVEIRPSLVGGTWQDFGALLEATQRSVRLPLDSSNAFFRIRLAR